jgi:hypothetical protein
LSVAFSTSVSDAARITSTCAGWPWYGLMRPCARYVRRRVFYSCLSIVVVIQRRYTHGGLLDNNVSDKEIINVNVFEFGIRFGILQ